MKIAFLQFYSSQPTPDYDQIARIMRQQGHNVWVGTPNQAGRLAWSDGERIIAVQAGPKPMPERVRSIPLGRSLWGRVAAFFVMLRIRGFLRQARPDIVQVNPSSVTGPWIIPILMPAQTRFVLDMRQLNLGKGLRNWGVRDGLRIVIMRLWSRFIYDWTCFATESAAQSALGRQWVRRSSAIPVGVSRHFAAFQPSHTRDGGRTDLVRFVYLGRLNKARRLERVLFAVQRVLEETNRFRVVLLGPEDEPGFYRRMTSDLKLDSVVAIQPPVEYERVPEAIADYDVALAYVPDVPDWRVQPSLKVLEYRALGLPILATDIPPNRDVVQSEVNGLLVPDTPEGLAHGMLRFISDRNLLDRCRSGAQTMRPGLSTWEQVADRYLEAYDSLLRGKISVNN